MKGAFEMKRNEAPMSDDESKFTPKYISDGIDMFAREDPPYADALREIQRLQEGNSVLIKVRDALNNTLDLNSKAYSDDVRLAKKRIADLEQQLADAQKRAADIEEQAQTAYKLFKEQLAAKEVELGEARKAIRVVMSEPPGLAQGEMENVALTERGEWLKAYYGDDVQKAIDAARKEDQSCQ